ncbi:ABC transporter ATP-binding protein [Acidocella facilis]|uniref:ABC transporter ATP-binding protein n=1 Tax=Acidocella facilis TaxID=525 RepID=UPI00068FFF36|nr:ABC transporter ATP-binding protein [Acidocella facilis]
MAPGLNRSVAEDAPLLALRGIVKQFPGTLANDHVDLTIGQGEIHALLGENGAGKSTLVKIIYGVMKPDAGSLRWRGQEVAINSPAQARALGIGMVFQHFSLFEALTVSENIALGLNDPKDRENLEGRIAEISSRYGLPLGPHKAVHDLSVGERQRIEIVRCLLQNPKLLIMDEPTSVLTPQEVQALFATLRRLRAEGCSILYISHKLEEIRSLCEAATIMRLGKVVAQCDPREKTARELAELMISAKLKTQDYSQKHSAQGPERLVVSKLTIRSNQQFGTDLKEISFAVKGGEIFGIAGIAGNGQSELMDALSGEIPAGAPGNILLDGAPVGLERPRARRRRGGCFLPEERNGHGAVGGMSLAENGFLSAHIRGALGRFGLINRRRTQEFAAKVISTFDVRTTGPLAEARSLSGGNLQKFLVGREVLQQPGVLVISQPTWGVDAGAAAAIYEALVALAQAGTAIVLISQDLDEILLLCDRIAVIAAGRLSEAMDVKDATIERIGLLMGGTQTGREEEHVVPA